MMRERIEKGEHVDIFTSADMGNAKKLVAAKRAATVVLFARNRPLRLCQALRRADDGELSCQGYGRRA